MVIHPAANFTFPSFLHSSSSSSDSLSSDPSEFVAAAAECVSSTRRRIRRGASEDRFSLGASINDVRMERGEKQSPKFGNK